MTKEHPNIALLQRLDPTNLAAAKDLIAEEAVFHYFNPNLPELQGDYVGLDGIRTFFEGRLDRRMRRGEVAQHDHRL